MSASIERRLTTLTLGEGSYVVVDDLTGDVLPHAFKSADDARILVDDANAYYASPFRRELPPEDFLRTWLISRGEKPPALPHSPEPERLKLVRL